VLFSIPI
jgi:hypothetical protein